ncbi:pseudouridine synthase [Armillaria novae-zelandiae]|uniref:tRNA pseudouridine synthase n=1 Tax=Armillaria novae-zelandiae TaxID=153914 RepID=A0AA39USZ3_9AGAR|nr:pseudouridine synthase [Armillaria novae-zelandiae]
MLVFGSLKIHRYRFYSTPSNTTSAQSNNDFDFYSYPVRKIALKFCYSGWEYNGLAFQKKPTPLPTVEGVLYDALCRARLIDEARGYDGCGWEKCGRTDRGVSAAGQVVSLWFSARRSCKFRHYKYFFSDLNLDLSLMREAASHLVGLHDFRNLCKIDASKQLTLFMRRILRAEINTVETGMFVFDLVGTAFLYHQVRNIMAVLLLVGRGIEPPDIITQLLNVAEGAEPGSWEVLSRKPEYQMADGLPLVLWDCGYDEKDVQWQTGGAEGEARGGQARGIYEHLESIYERSRVSTTLNHHFLKKAAELHSSRPVVTRQETPFHEKWNHSEGIEVPLGAGATRRIRQYVPLMRRVRNDEVEGH